VIEPNGGEILYSGSTFAIELQINTQGLPGKAANEKLYYKCSVDPDWILIANRTCSYSGYCPLTYPWEVPWISPTKTGCKVKAKILDSGGSLLGQDSSAGNFKIKPY
jgi:hypothetical protein